MIQTFEDLHAWQYAHKVVLAVYGFTGALPDDERYGLIAQMRRAAVSVTSNIAEGYGRISRNEKYRFYVIANGSLLELQNQIIVTRDVGYAQPQDVEVLLGAVITARKVLWGLIRSTKQG